MPDNAKRTGAAIEAHYQFLAWLAPAIEKLPKSHKFTIGDRIHSEGKRIMARNRAPDGAERNPGSPSPQERPAPDDARTSPRAIRATRVRD